MRPSPASDDAPASGAPAETEPLARGELARVAYRLGRAAATGVLTVYAPGARPEILVLRRGRLITGEAGARSADRRLSRIASLIDARFEFDGGTHAHPPGATGRQLCLARWARRHLERQVDAPFARRLARELAGARLRLRPELEPEATQCDETDRRILDVMRTPRRIDEIGPLARAPRLRLAAFLHFLRRVGAVSLIGVAAPQPWPPARRDHHTLGVTADADRETVKRAYRRLARALHPDLHPGASARRRRALEDKMAEANEAYRRLTGAGAPPG